MTSPGLAHNIVAVPSNEQAPLAGPERPLGAPQIPQFHLPATAAAGVFRPRLYGAASIHFADRKRKIDETRRVAFLVPLDTTARTIDWDAAQAMTLMPDQLLARPPKTAKYLPLPAAAMQVNTITRWAKSFDRWLARTQRLEVPAAAGQETQEPSVIGPKRGGVSVEIVAIVWELA
jgi:hypothetical protein